MGNDKGQTDDAPWSPSTARGCSANAVHACTCADGALDRMTCKELQHNCCALILQLHAQMVSLAITSCEELWCSMFQMVFLVITHCEELRYYGPFEEKEAQAHREEIRR
eukprot:scaffold274820_cov15-Tisochrysis_lutea.AAC.1